MLYVACVLLIPAPPFPSQEKETLAALAAAQREIGLMRTALNAKQRQAAEMEEALQVRVI